MDDLVGKFAALGVSEYEARAYLALVRVREATGPGIAQQANVPLSKIYEVMERLCRKGLVLVNPSSKPRRYKAIDPQVAVQALVGAKKQNLDDATTFLLNHLSQSVLVEQDKGVWIVRGQHAIDALVLSLVSRSKSTVLHYTTGQKRAWVARLRDVAVGGTEIDFKPSEIASNVLEVDRRDTIVFVGPGEALWIRKARRPPSRAGEVNGSRNVHNLSNPETD